MEPTLDEEFKLLDGSFSVSDVQDYFECIIRKLETLTDNTFKYISTWLKIELH